MGVHRLKSAGCALAPAARWRCTQDHRYAELLLPLPATTFVVLPRSRPCHAPGYAGFLPLGAYVPLGGCGTEGWVSGVVFGNYGCEHRRQTWVWVSAQAILLQP